jgi:hypothetical protein
VGEQAEDHSIRKDLGLASGRERPPREGRGADFRAAEGGRSRPLHSPLLG